MRLTDADKVLEEWDERTDDHLITDSEFHRMINEDLPLIELGWHYPSKGEYPPVGEFDATSHLVLVFWWSTDCNGKKAKVYGLDRWCEQHKEWDNYPQRPIAWQPLPEPPKEEA